MAWLARLDARVATWPTFWRWTYRALKWYLVLLGGFLMLMTYLERLGIWSRH